MFYYPYRFGIFQTPTNFFGISIFQLFFFAKKIANPPKTHTRRERYCTVGTPVLYAVRHALTHSLNQNIKKIDSS